MPKRTAVIDGSNLATEGRTEPSLKQLDEAVRAIETEYDFARVIVIVDASFEHRVATSEQKAARREIDSGKIITPPAGVIGRGDAFILQVADRADAVVFSNDSFQEFHGTYDWLFDEGRLVGGKPIPSVGWIYVARLPVRGPVSRRATAGSRKAAAKKAAPRTRTRAKKSPEPPDDAAPPAEQETPRAPRTRGTRRSSKARTAASESSSSHEGSNDAARWKAFKADYPVGSTIAATVDRFSSHGAYGSVDGIVVYLPNRLLGDPAPTKARDVLDLGATMDFVIHRYDNERNGIDAGLTPAPDAPGRARGAARKRSTAARKTTKKAAVKKTAVKKTTKKAAAKAPAKKTTAKKTAAKKTAAKAPAKKTAARRSTTKKTTAKKAAAKKTTAKKTAARRSTTKR